jgi:hypothetical protein
MDRKTRLLVGWVVTVVAALGMVLGAVPTEVGLVAGTAGFLMLGTASGAGRAGREENS